MLISSLGCAILHWGPPEAQEDWHWKLLMKDLSKNAAEEGCDDEEFCKAYEALEEHEEQYQRWMERDNIFWLQASFISREGNRANENSA